MNYNDDKYDSTHAESLGHELVEVNARTVSLAGAALLGVMFAGMLMMGVLFYVLMRAEGGDAVVGVPTGAPPVDDQRGTLRRLREAENRILTEYAWVDANTGIARIPISRAMEIVAERTAAPAEGEP